MRYAIPIAAALFVSLAIALPALAGGYEPPVRTPPIPDAEKVVFDCDEAQSADYEGSPAQMRRAAFMAAMCIRDAIVENMVILAGEEYRQKVIDQLEQINKGVGAFYWALYNEIEPCFRNQPSCGTMYHSFHNAHVRAVYADILRATIRQRQQYRW